MEGKRRIVQDETGEIKKGPWKEEEDQVLINHVKKHGPRDWSSLRSKGLLRRTGKSCRLRWVNKLRPDLKNGVKFTAEEERIVIDLQSQFGNKWARIATYLAGRTDNDVKNFWSSRRKRLARIQHTAAPSSSNSHNNVKEADHFPSTEVKVLNFNSSAEGESMGKPEFCSLSHVDESHQIMDMMPLPELLYPSSICYDPSSLHLEEKPFFDSQSDLSFPQLQPDYPLPLDNKEFTTKLGDPAFLDIFGCAELPNDSSCFLPDRCCGIAGKQESTLDTFVDEFPPMDMFEQIESLPSPSEWS